jgi:hypothetical protein
VAEANTLGSYLDLECDDDDSESDDAGLHAVRKGRGRGGGGGDWIEGGLSSEGLLGDGLLGDEEGPCPWTERRRSAGDEEAPPLPCEDRRWSDPAGEDMLIPSLGWETRDGNRGN